MIGRTIKGRGFRGLLNYVAGKPDALRIGGNMSGRTPRELAQEFGQVRQLRPNLGQAVLHLPLRPAPGETLSEEQWQAIAERVLVHLGYENAPYALFLHREPEPHLHVIASRITYDGRVVSTSNDRYRLMEVLRDVERDYGLRVVPHRESGRTPPDQHAYKLLERTGEASVRAFLQESIRAAARGRPGLPLFFDRLRQAGVTPLPNVASTGRVTGISYAAGGLTFKGSGLGADFSWRGIQQRLHVRYDPDQDLGAVLAARAGAARASGPEPAPGMSDPSAADLVLGPSVDFVTPPAAGFTPAPAADLARPSAADLALGPTPASAPSPATDPAPVAAADHAPAPAAGRPPAPASPASTRAAGEVARHLEALGAYRYHVLLLHPGRGERTLRAGWSAEQVARALPWLRAQNAQGAEVLVRPSDPGCSVLTGISAEALARAREAGIEPALTVRVGDLYEVWLRHSQALTAEQRAALPPLLAEAFGSSPGRAPADYGHLAGFAARPAPPDARERLDFASVAAVSQDAGPGLAAIERRAAELVGQARLTAAAQAEVSRFDELVTSLGRSDPAATLARTREAEVHHAEALARAERAPDDRDAQEGVLASHRELLRARGDLARLAGRPDLAGLAPGELEAYLDLRGRLAAAEQRVLSAEERWLAAPGHATEPALRAAELGRLARLTELAWFESVRGLPLSTHATPEFLTPETPVFPAFPHDSPPAGPWAEELQLAARAASLQLEIEHLDAAQNQLAFRLGRIEELARTTPGPASLDACSRLLAQVDSVEQRLSLAVAEASGVQTALRSLDLARQERQLLAAPGADRLGAYIRTLLADSPAPERPGGAGSPSLSSSPSSRSPLAEASRRFLAEPTAERLADVRAAAGGHLAALRGAQRDRLARELSQAREEMRSLRRPRGGPQGPGGDADAKRWARALSRLQQAEAAWSLHQAPVPSPADLPRLLGCIAAGDTSPATVAAARRAVAHRLGTVRVEPLPPEPPSPAGHRQAVVAERQARAALVREIRSALRAPVSPALHTPGDVAPPRNPPWDSSPARLARSAVDLGISTTNFPDGTPGTDSLLRLDARLAAYQAATREIARHVARPDGALPPRFFLSHPAYRDRPGQALAAWAAHAARGGVAPERIGAALASAGRASCYAVPRVLAASVVYPLGRAAHWGVSAALRQVPGASLVHQLRRFSSAVSLLSASPSQLVVRAGLMAYGTAFRQINRLLHSP